MTALRIRTAVTVYGALAAAAVGIGALRDNLDVFHHPEGILSGELSFWPRLAVGLLSGAFFGGAVVRATQYSVYRFKWAKALHTEFRGLLGPLGSLDIIAFAGLSAVAEELFFRGALQPVIGIVATSLVFGLLHIGPDKKFLVWTAQAAAMGFALGGLFWVTGDLIAPMTAHFVINYQNLHFINRYDPVLRLPRALASQDADESVGTGSTHMLRR